MKNYLTITCGSFTAVILSFLLLFPLDLAPAVTNATAFQVFVMSASIAFVMVLAERFQNDSMLVNLVTKVLICYAVVFLEGGLFGMTELSWRGLLQITPALAPAFAVTYALHYLTCVKWADEINRSIRRKK